MKDYLISMFIDNELDLDQKVEWIEAVSSDRCFKNEALDLLNQEKMLCSEMVDRVPPVVIEERHRAKISLFPAVGFFSSGLAAALVVFFVWLSFQNSFPGPQTDRSVPYRFVVYQPGVARAEISGSFTGWRTVPMTRTGNYWEVTLALPQGEHRFSYIFDGDRKVADPTIPIRERDDFGGENSILELKRSI